MMATPTSASGPKAMAASMAMDRSGRVELFHGGNPLPTVPYHVFTPRQQFDPIQDAQVAGDINGDGYRDLLLDLEFDHDWQTSRRAVFYGGPAFGQPAGCVAAAVSV